MGTELLEVKGMALVQAEPSTIGVLKQRLTLTSTNEDKPCVVQLYKECGKPDCLYIPRGVIPADKTIPVSGEWAEVSFQPQFTLRPQQIPLVSGFIDAVKHRSPYGGILRAKTGVGKTVMGMEIMARLGLKTLIIVPLDRLVGQWIHGEDGKGGMKKLLGLKDKDIGIIRQNKCEYKGKKVVVAMIHSLARDLETGRYPAEIYDDFGLVIVDEVHVLGAQTFSKVAPEFNCKIRLGLSATPRRKDGMEKVFLHHIGKVLVNHDKLEMKPKVYMVPYEGADATDIGCKFRGKLHLGAYLNRLAQLPERNRKIVSYILQGYRKGRDILVLSDRISQLDILRSMLMSEGVPLSDIGTMTSKVKQSDRKITLATYGTFGMGVDVPRLSMLIVATPRVDMEQAVGRILRSMGDKADPVVVDLVDTASGVMIGWAISRLNKQYTPIAEKVVCKANLAR